MNIEYNNNLSADDYCMLRKSVGWSDISIIIVEKAIEKSDYIITAELNSTKIGMGRVINDGTQAFILDVVVHPDYQGFGIGKSMMLKIMGYLKDNLQQGQNILVNLSATKGREDFYTKFGFEVRPTEKLGKGLAQWISSSSEDIDNE